LRERDFATEVQTILHEAGLPASQLTIEVTETAVFDDGQALQTLRAVHDLGVRVALDDFGTGHSSLRLLRECPVDILKVDKSFVECLPGTKQQTAVATSLADIADALDLEAVAEGVETLDQAQALRRLGYRLAQGFYFGRPVGPEEIDSIIAGSVGGGDAGLLPPSRGQLELLGRGGDLVPPCMCWAGPRRPTRGRT